jgi:hypothetical protein
MGQCVTARIAFGSLPSWPPLSLPTRDARRGSYRLARGAATESLGPRPFVWLCDVSRAQPAAARHSSLGLRPMGTADGVTAILSRSAVVTHCHPQDVSCVQNGSPLWARDEGASVTHNVPESRSKTLITAIESCRHKVRFSRPELETIGRCRARRLPRESFFRCGRR